MVQLSAQRGRVSFLISGSVSEDDDFSDGHGFNVVFKNNIPYLVDAENPLAVDSRNRVLTPLIAPILGIKEKYGDFVIPSEFNNGLTYSFS